MLKKIKKMFLTLIIRLRDGGITALVVIILVILIGWGSAKLLNKDDCYIEEVCEDAKPYGLTAQEVAAAIDFLKARRDNMKDIISNNRCG